jgi:ABC-type amino acid transport substrate-binding protein
MGKRKVLGKYRLTLRAKPFTHGIGRLLAMGFLLCSLAAFAHAEDSKLHQIIQTKEIRIGTSGDYQPFSYLNPKTNQYEGMDIDLAHKLGQALQAKVFFVRFKWPELTPDLLAGKFDIAMGGIGRNVWPNLKQEGLRGAKRLRLIGGRMHGL